MRSRTFPSLYLWDESFPANLGKPGVCFEGGEVFFLQSWELTGGDLSQIELCVHFGLPGRFFQSDHSSEQLSTATELSKLWGNSWFFGGQHLLSTSSPLVSL